MQQSNGLMITTNSQSKTVMSSTLRRQQIVLRSTNTNDKCQTNASLEVITAPPCFPMDVLYTNLKAACQRDRRRFMNTTFTGQWPTTIYKVFVNSGIVLGQLEVNTTLLDAPMSPGKYTLRIKGSPVRLTMEFEYYTKLSKLKESDDFFPRVTGTSFRISLYKEFYLDNPHVISIAIESVGNTKGGTHVRFLSGEALTLFGSVRQKRCPSGACLDHFSEWRMRYIELMMKARPDCATDESMYFSYTSFCDDTGKSFNSVTVTLDCSGAPLRQPTSLFYYKIVYYKK